MRPIGQVCAGTMRIEKPDSPSQAWLQGGGEMGQRIRSYDWSQTPLGEPGCWPQSLKTLTGLMLASAQPMWVGWGPSLIWLSNDAFIPILGSKHPHALGRPALAEVWSEAKEVLTPMFDRVLSGDPIHMQDFALQLDRNGRLEEAHFAFSYTPARDESGTVAGIFCACIETTAQVAMQRQQAAAQERQRRMFEQAPSFMCIMEGPQHVFEFVNNAHRKLFNSGGWLGKPAREAFPDLTGQGYFEQLDEVYKSGKRFIATSAPVRYRLSPERPQEERIMDFIYEPIVDDAGNITGIFCEGFDVTAQRQAEKALREGDRRKDEFIATLAHELRNPLAPIKNGLQIARLSSKGDATLQRTVAMMDRQLSHLVRLVDDLLDVGRISSGKIDLRRNRVRLSEVLATSIEASQTLIDAHKHELVVDSDDEELPVEGDFDRLSQVFSNLLSNAAKYTDNGGRITVEIRRHADEAVVQVRDTGIGIPRAELSQVFDLFSQVRMHQARAEGGLGIGLALVRKLVELHGGRVSVASDGLGAGSTFCVHLPLAVGAAQAAVWGPSETFLDTETSKRRVLVVDDNADAANSLAMLLDMQGHEVFVAHDGLGALDKFTEARPDIVFLDLGMPEMDGVETLTRMRALPEGQATKIVALTGWGQEADRDRTRTAGFDQHIVKPLTLETLLAVLRSGN